MIKLNTSKFNAQQPLTFAEERQLKKNMTSFSINEELIEFLHLKIKSIIDIDKKLWVLYFTKKTLPYLDRRPCPQHFRAFEDDYLMDRASFDPAKWVEKEIEFLLNIKTLGNERTPDQAILESKAELSKLWLNRDEIMELLSISRTTLNRRISEGMPCHPRGKSNFFNLEEVSEWLKQDIA